MKKSKEMLETGIFYDDAGIKLTNIWQQEKRELSNNKKGIFPKIRIYIFRYVIFLPLHF
jgi:hypothetical protein